MRAFIVEDDPEFGDALAEVLEHVGWKVDLAEDGIAALGCIYRAIPDLITLDLGLPNLTGLQVPAMTCLMVSTRAALSSRSPPIPLRPRRSSRPGRPAGR